MIQAMTIIMNIGDNIKIGDVKHVGWSKDNLTICKVLKIKEVNFGDEGSNQYEAVCQVSTKE